ncbi:hypothetical protein JW933_08935 [candidate division FCPU426 bacterium]|nr:hypothetical protein [candidate division FCPU426 bacterium]
MKRIVFSLGFIIICTLPCRAEIQDNDIKGRIGVYGNLGMASLAVDELNNRIQEYGSLNDASRKIANALALHYALRWGLTNYFQLGVIGGLEIITGEFGYANGDKISVSLGGMETGVEARFSYPLGAKLRFSAGAGISLYRIDKGSITFTTGGAENKVPYSGTTFAFRPSIGYDYFIWRNLALGLEGGYRVAQMTLSTQQASPWGNLFFDANGLYGSLGIRVYW